MKITIHKYKYEFTQRMPILTILLLVILNSGHAYIQSQENSATVYKPFNTVCNCTIGLIYSCGGCVTLQEFDMICIMNIYVLQEFEYDMFQQ